MALEKKIEQKQEKQKATTIDQCAEGTVALHTPPFGPFGYYGCNKTCCPKYSSCQLYTVPGSRW